jgi:two-component system sensor histidine kinase KdpD
VKADPARPDRRARERVLWGGAALAATALLLALREEIGEAHVALAYLLVVLGASARGGRRLGLLLAVLCFFAFNFFFLRPYHTLAVHNPLDWLVLAAFLATSAVATQLLHRARSEAEAARRRTAEVDRLATLGAEALNAPRAEDAVVAVARVVQSGLDVAACEVYLHEESGGRVRRIARASRDGAEAPRPEDPGAAADEAEAAGGVGPGGSVSAAEVLLAADARVLLIPLRARERPVGILRLEGDRVIALDGAQQRFAEALAYYAALALDRLRLAVAAEHAEALREADRLKDALLASVSHDLRTPLTTIKALAHAIAAEGDERAAAVEEEADRLARFVSDLLDLSSLDAGAPSPAPELVAADDVLGAALQRLAGATRGRTVRASLDPAEPLLVGRFDFVHTLRALVNLVENALKYSPPESPVEVSVRREGDRIAFAVADRGPGIDPADRERIFEPFVRGAGPPDVGGAGLGLPIARRSAELQGGEVRCAPRPGGGSVFTLLLPAAAVEELERMSL